MSFLFVLRVLPLMVKVPCPSRTSTTTSISFLMTCGTGMLESLSMRISCPWANVILSYPLVEYCFMVQKYVFYLIFAIIFWLYNLLSCHIIATFVALMSFMIWILMK